MKRTAKHQTTFFAAILLIAVLFCNQITAYAYNPAHVSEYTSTEFTRTVPQYWNVRVSNNVLSVELHDITAGNGRRTLLKVNESIRYWGEFQNGVCNLAVSLDGLPDGIYGAVISEARTDQATTLWSIAKLQVQIADRNTSVYFPYGQSERDFLNNLNALYDPKDYLTPPDDVKEYRNLEDMTSMAQSITADCKTDEEKVKAIHDWVTLNFAYDYESLNNGNKHNAADPQLVFDNKRAVCSGFTRVARVLYTAVGIPCINISGYTHKGSVFPDNAEQMGTTHEWNAVYLNGSWRIIDITWDCRNKYYGENSENNVLGLAGIYTYYGIPAEVFGHNHLSMGIDANYYDKGIKVEKVSPEKSSYTYTGKSKEPQVTVVNEYGDTVDSKYYTLSYSDNTKVGTASLTVSFKGGYSWNAPITVRYKIVPKGTKISKIKPASKSLRVSFKKQTTETTGYQIRYSTYKNMKNAKTVTINRNTTGTETITGLKAKKTYYVQIRTYKTVSGKKYYSSWSAKASGKTLPY